MKKHIAGFTLVEILVVVAIISILAAVLYANFGQAGAQSRDAKRKADLTTVQAAIELYRQENGEYPAGCNGAGNWSSQADADTYDCPGDDSQYIVGLAPKYIPVLPTDPKLNGSDSGYMYLTNTNGTVYKFVAMKTVESEEYSSYGQDYPFKPCDVKTVGGNLFTTTPTTGLPQEGTSGGNPFYGYAICNRYYNAGYVAAPDCSIGLGSNARITYSVWGGYSDINEPGPAVPGPVNDDGVKEIEYRTERIVCDLP